MEAGRSKSSDVWWLEELKGQRYGFEYVVYGIITLSCFIALAKSYLLQAIIT